MTLITIVIIHKFCAYITVDVRESAGGIDEVEGVPVGYWIGKEVAVEYAFRFMFVTSLCLCNAYLLQWKMKCSTSSGVLVQWMPIC